VVLDGSKSAALKTVLDCSYGVAILGGDQLHPPIAETTSQRIWGQDMSQCKGRYHSFINELEADDRNQGDGELVLLNLRRSLDQAVHDLCRETSYERQNDREQRKGLWDREGEEFDLGIGEARFSKLATVETMKLSDLDICLPCHACQQ
jgi:hypothetical protein